jgi:hypothetical protein
VLDPAQGPVPEASGHESGEPTEAKSEAGADVLADPPDDRATDGRRAEERDRPQGDHAAPHMRVAVELEAGVAGGQQADARGADEDEGAELGTERRLRTESDANVRRAAAPADEVTKTGR